VSDTLSELYDNNVIVPELGDGDIVLDGKLEY